MSANSSGEIELVYNGDTTNYHKYHGTKGTKHVVVYLERSALGFPVPNRINAIIDISDKYKSDCSEEIKTARIEGRREAYFHNRDAQRALDLSKDRLDSIEFRRKQIELLSDMNTNLNTLIRLLNERTKVNSRRSTKKRS